MRSFTGDCILGEYQVFREEKLRRARCDDFVTCMNPANVEFKHTPQKLLMFEGIARQLEPNGWTDRASTDQEVVCGIGFKQKLSRFHLSILTHAARETHLFWDGFRGLDLTYVLVKMLLKVRLSR